MPIQSKLTYNQMDPFPNDQKTSPAYQSSWMKKFGHQNLEVYSLWRHNICEKYQTSIEVWDASCPCPHFHFCNHLPFKRKRMKQRHYKTAVLADQPLFL